MNTSTLLVTLTLACLISIANAVSEKQAKAFIADFDVDGSGVLDENEYRTGVENIGAAKTAIKFSEAANILQNEQDKTTVNAAKLERICNLSKYENDILKTNIEKVYPA